MDTNSTDVTKSSDTPVHGWLRPRLQALVEQAGAAGFPRQTVVAVILDIIGGPPFDQPSASEALPEPEPAERNAPSPDPLGLELELDRIRTPPDDVPQPDVPEIAKPLM